MKEILNKLAAPFPPDRISWRLGSTNADKTKGMALAYIDARDVMQRLDEVCGAFWQADYLPMPNGSCCCRVGILVDDYWVWRSNGAQNFSESDKVDAKEMSEKASYSDAFKRAAVLWGIGRYLYDLDSPWVALVPAGRSYRIADNEMGRLRKILGNAKPAPMPSPPPPEDDNRDAGALIWPIMVPGQQEPYTRCATAEVWVMEINELAERITNSTKVPEVDKKPKLEKLRDVNLHVIEALPEELRNGLTI
jgi:hypothetical protein